MLYNTIRSIWVIGFCAAVPSASEHSCWGTLCSISTVKPTKRCLGWWDPAPCLGVGREVSLNPGSPLQSRTRPSPLLGARCPPLPPRPTGLSTHPSASNEGWGCSCSPRCGNPHQCVKPTASPALQAGICLLELSMCCVPGLLLPSTASVRIYGHRNHSEAYSDSDQ